jgi:hypothetical protein
LLTAPERDRARDNWRQSTAQQKEAGGLFVEELETEPGRQPIGYVLPNGVFTGIALVSEDPFVVKASMRTIPDPMDRDPDGDFPFPNLTPEEYDYIRALAEAFVVGYPPLPA